MLVLLKAYRVNYVISFKTSKAVSAKVGSVT